MPVTYICPMHGAILEDKPGVCPICKMALEPVRIEQAWACPGNTARILDAPGKCPTNRALDLVPITVAHYYVCAGTSTFFADPGTCADGSRRIEKREVREHGDHNPRHGGEFFMAEDMWHHLEGTYPRPGLFRAFFYDNFTKDLAPDEFSGRVIVTSTRETVPLVRSRDGKTLDAVFKTTEKPSKASPTLLRAFVQFRKDGREQPFDFTFADLSREPVAAAPVTTRAPAPAEPPPPQDAPVVVDVPLNMPPGLAEALDESKLPTTPAGLLAELESRAQQVDSLATGGNLAEIWLPAMGTKTVALAIDARSRELPAPLRAAVSAAVTEIVAAAWAIDAYGDLGNRQKIVEANRRLAAAVAALKAIHGQ
jgi:hypothetical protein